MQLERVISPEEIEFAELTLRIAWRSRHIDALEAELRPLQQAFEKFEWAYAQRVGRLAAELQTLRGTIQQIEQKTARVHARLVSDPGGVLGDIFDRDELREIGEMFGVDVLDDWFANERSGRPDDVEWSWTDETSEEEEILRRLRQERHRRLHGDIGDELRSLYRSLARRFHPDLARSDEERAFRQEVMLRINHAWQCQDLSMLRDIDQELAVIVPGFSPSHMAHRVAWARRERARLDQRAASLMRRIRQLRTSKTFPLWFNPALGQSTIANRAASLERDIAREQERLEDARMAFQQALAHYATTIA
ncbi:MAG TPA: J domain-containing protein [Thermomicrobiales bacterium]|nr:J domain-containing protein [Thermomicrobiales bacterium]